MAEPAKLLQFDVWLATTECCNCGIVFGMPNSLMKQHREEGTSFYCPNGHGQHFTETEVQRLKKELDRTKANSQREIEWQKGQRLVAERQLIAKKGQITKLKNRVAKGVCPCCNRQFTDLHRHMTTKHPDFATTE